METRETNKSVFYHAPKEEATVFIFKEMTPNNTDSTLKRSTKCSALTLKAEDMQRIWLIRESRAKGALTVQSIVFDKTNDRWWGFEDRESNNVFLKPGSKISDGEYVRMNNDGTTTEFDVMPNRFWLTNTGWIIDNHGDPDVHQKILEEHGGLMSSLTAETAGPYVISLLNEIVIQLKYNPIDRINPLINQQTMNRDYAKYDPHSQKVKDYERITSEKITKEKIQPIMAISPPPPSNFSLFLPADIANLFVCPFTKQMIKDPVILISDGKTYEYDSLIKKGYLAGKDFCKNLLFKNIIETLSSSTLNREQIIKEIDTLTSDVITNDRITDAMVSSSSGLTYDKTTLERWMNRQLNYNIQPIEPSTGMPITSKELLPNNTVREFIHKWDSFYGNELRILKAKDYERVDQSRKMV